MSIIFRAWSWVVFFLLGSMALATCTAPSPPTASKAAGVPQPTVAAEAPSAATPVSTPSGTPRLSVDRDEADFGEVPYGKIVQQTFLVKNTGTGPLIIGDVRLRTQEGC